MNFMEYNDFDYLRNSPFKVKKYKILPLSSVGVTQYNTKDSYSHKYLKSFDHLRIKQEEIKENPPIGANENGSHPQVEIEIETPQSSVKFKPKVDIKKSKTITSISVSNFHKNTNSFNSFYSTKNYFNLTRIKNFKKNSKQVVSEDKYIENHEENLKNLSKSVKDFFKRKSNISVHGFRADEIPHIVSSPRSPCSIEFMKRIEKTLPRFKKEEDENKKFDTILKTIKKYESNSKYPKLKNILNQGEIKNIEIFLGNNKIMGEKYNPLNFYHCSSKTNKRRNLHGATFEH